MTPVGGERQRTNPGDRRQRQLGVEMGKLFPPREVSQLSWEPKVSASTATSSKSPRPENHLAAVSGACAAVEKWM